MERRKRKLIKLALATLIQLLIFIILVVSMVKFVNADEVIDKVEYGITTLAMMILIFRE